MARPPIHTEDQLMDLARSLADRHGTVSVMALRAAAGGGSPNRIQRILASMAESHPAPARGRERGERPHGSEASVLLRRIEEMERACAEIRDLIREERRCATAEIRSLARLIERQSLFLESFGHMMDCAFKLARQDVQSMREELGNSLGDDGEP